jgi:hypothetical protein
MLFGVGVELNPKEKLKALQLVSSSKSQDPARKIDLA